MTGKTAKWTSTSSGLWSKSANWANSYSPQLGDSVVIAPAAPLTVTFDVLDANVANLTLFGSTLTLQGGGLSVTGVAQVSGAKINGQNPLTVSGSTYLRPLAPTATTPKVTIGGSASLLNSGSVLQSGETLAIGDSSVSKAVVKNLAGATWFIDDASGMTQTGPARYGFYNYGTFNKTSGSGVSNIRANFYSVGTIASTQNGDIEFDGKNNNISGVYIGAGMIDYGVGSVSTLGKIDVTASSCQGNWGTVNLVGDMTMHTGSTIMNDAVGVWNFKGNSSLKLAAGEAAGPDINGKGVIAKTAGTGVSHVSINVDAEGEVKAITGTLSFEGATSVFSSTISGAGTFQIAAGAATLKQGASLTVANWRISGGTTTLGEYMGFSNSFIGAGGALSMGGYGITLSGATTFSAFTLKGGGSLALAGSTTITNLTVSGTFIDQEGAVTIGDADPTHVGKLVVRDGGVWSLSGSNGLASGASTASALSIASTGLLKKSGAGVSIVKTAVTNNGVNAFNGGSLSAFRGVEVDTGTLAFQGAVTGTGVQNINGAATLEFDAAVGSGQTIDFWGTGGSVLLLNDLAHFRAAILGFDAGGGKDFLQIGGGWNFAGASETASAATLNFGNAGSTASLVLTGDYRSAGFHAVASGGVTTVTWG